MTIKRMMNRSLLFTGALIGLFLIAQLAVAAVAHDAVSQSAEFGSGDTSPITFTHTPAGTPQGILCGVITRARSDEIITGITYGGIPMTRVDRAVDTSGEPGSAAPYFLGTNIPAGSQTVTVSFGTFSSWSGIVSCVSMTAAGDTVVAGSAKAEEDQADPQVTLDTGSDTALRYVQIYSGAIAPTSLSLLSNMTDLGLGFDYGPASSRMDSQTTLSSGSVTLGYTASSDDVAMVAAAIKEGAAGPDTTPPTTTATPSGGTYAGTQSVTLSVNEPATTYYTIDGSTPTTSSLVYSTSLSLSEDTTVKFFSVDTAGNTESVNTETYTILPPDTTAPTVSLTAPSNGATVSSTITVAADASDDVGVSGVTFKYNGITISSEDTSSPYSVSWNTTSVTNDTYTLTAVARDAAGNTTTSSGITVTVSNSAPPPSGAGDPVILYTDIVSGPNTGGENNNGAYLSIYGKNFGTSRASGDKVFINNTEVAAYKQWGAPSMTYAYNGIQVISVQPGSAVTTGSLVVGKGCTGSTPSTCAQQSNTEHAFTVRPGDIYFVAQSGSDTIPCGAITAPCRTLQYVYDSPGYDAGDFMVVRGGTWTDVGDSSGSRWLEIDGAVSPTAANPVTIYGYPGEEVVYDHDPGADRGFSAYDTAGYNLSGFVFANFHFINSVEAAFAFGRYSTCPGTDCGDWHSDIRVVNIGINASPSDCMPDSGVIGVARSNNGKLLGIYVKDRAIGNTCNPKYSGAKAIYFSNRTDNYEVGWFIIDNLQSINGGPGIQIRTADNNTEPQAHKNITIHDSKFFDMCRDAVAYGESAAQGMLFYNNFVYNTGTCSDSTRSGVTLGNPGILELEMYNNVFYGQHPGEEALREGRYKSLTLKNNIFMTADPTENYYAGADFDSNPPTASNNVWYGSAQAVPSWDTNPIMVNPLFIDPTAPARNFRLQSSSPAIDAGTNTGIARDFDGTSRPQGLAYDIGAFEYVSSGGGDTTAPTVSLTAPSDGATVSGTVTVSADASDNVGVAGVQFKRNGVNVSSEDTTSPYSVSWDTTAVSDGSYTLTAVARDAAGNTTTSGSRSVTVSNGTSDTTTNVSISVSLEREASVDSQSVTLELYNVGGSTILHTETKSPTSGSLTFSSLPVSPGSYDVRLNAPYYLSQKETMTLSDSADLTFPELPAGDVNNDNAINSTDWTYLSGKWFTSDPVADINRDSLVNSLDFSVMNGNWLDAGE